MNAERKKNHGGSSSPLLIGANLVLIVCIVLLAIQNRRLATQLADSRHKAPFNAATSAFRPGETLPDLPVYAHDGEVTTIPLRQSSGATMLLVGAPDCQACDDIKSFWNALAETLATTNVHVIGISLPVENDRAAGRSDPDQRYEQFSLALKDPVVLGKFSTLPAALLIDGSGTVVGAWYGPSQAQSLQPILDAAMNVSSQAARVSTD